MLYILKGSLLESCIFEVLKFYSVIFHQVLSSMPKVEIVGKRHYTRRDKFLRSVWEFSLMAT